MIRRLLFVCTGNTCRSPMAETIAREMADQRGLDVEAASAGLMAASGEPAARLAGRVARARGLDLSGHRSRPISAELLDGSDLVLGMTRAHVDSLRPILGERTARIVTAFLSAESALANASIADPFGGDLDDYERAWAELEASVAALLDYIEGGAA